MEAQDGGNAAESKSAYSMSTTPNTLPADDGIDFRPINDGIDFQPITSSRNSAASDEQGDAEGIDFQPVGKVTPFSAIVHRARS